MKRHTSTAKVVTFWLFILTLLVVPGRADIFADSFTNTDRRRVAAARETYGKLPLSFEANRGQTEPSAQFLARGAGYSLFLTGNEAVFVMSRRDKQAPSSLEPAKHRETQEATNSALPRTTTRTALLRMNLVGTNSILAAEGLEEQAGKANYFIGNDSTKWQVNIPTFSRVQYKNVYSGIDLTYYGNQRQLEYDFIVAPNADYKQIELNFKGAKKVEIERASGDLLLRTRFGVMREHQPKVYQEIDGARQEIAGRYVMRGHGRIGFEVGEYDTALPLVIDPTIVYSTFIGGSTEDRGNAIAVDSTGNTYIIGTTLSPDFPTTVGAFDRTSHNQQQAHVFVTKLNASGSALIYSTLIGGGGNDNGTAIAIDSTGNAYVTGVAGGQAPIYPTTAGAFQTTYGGGLLDVFVTKLNASGSALIYSTLISGGGTDSANGIAIDSTGNAYVTGQTGGSAPPYPTTPGAFQTTNRGANVFVTKLNADGSALIYSTFIGGSGLDFGNGIAIDPTGNAYLTGSTSSVDFPTTPGAFQTTNNSNSGNNDVFVTKLNAGGSALIYSTYIGGVLGDLGNGIAIDSTGNAYVTGSTSSPAYPTTAGAFQTTRSGSSDVFFTKLNASGSALIYSTYIGGTNDDVGTAIAIDSNGNAYLTGFTLSTNYPTTAGAFQTTNNGPSDVFVTKIETTTPRPATLGDISTRLQVGSADRVMIAGFIVQGSAPKRVLIRAAGPSLTQFGVPNALANPRLELHDTNNTIGTNDDWQTTQIGGVITSDQVAEIQSSGLAPRDPAESAIIATLPPGSYTAIVQGVNGGTGVGIVEAYDLDATSGSLLANIATRGFVQTGDDAMIGGFIVVTQPTKVIIRAIGPSLTQFGVPDALANPQLELHDANNTLARNDDWQTTQIFGIITSDQVAEIQNSQLAPTNSAESAIIATLQPGNYTAIVRGVNNTTGNALVEVYSLP